MVCSFITGFTAMGQFSEGYTVYLYYICVIIPPYVIYNMRSGQCCMIETYGLFIHFDLL